MSDFPQADVLAQVGEVAIAISKGNTADKKIEEYIGLGSKGRQGRYYRLAAANLGLVINSKNHAELTAVGEEYAKLETETAKLDFLARCLLESPVFHEGLKYIQAHSPNIEQLKLWFMNFYPGEKSTAGRRWSSFIAYLNVTGLARQKAGGSYVVKKYHGAVAMTVTPVVPGLTGKTVAKNSDSPPIPTASGTIKFEVDAQKKERANQTHWKLVAAKSDFLVALGLPAFENNLVDLFSRADKDVIIYEMKSASLDGANLASQIRKAVAQLYEYRYVFATPEARLCIVTNSAVAKADAWLMDYLAKDRQIAYEWTDDYKNFQCHATSKALLADFGPAI